MFQHEWSRPLPEQLEQIVQTVPGWTPPDQLCALFNLAVASAHVPGDIIEIGSWCGRSAAVLALAARFAGQGRVHCVDLFPTRRDWYRNADGSYSFQVTVDGEAVRAYATQTVWQEPFERDIAPLYERCNGILDYFRSTMDRFALSDGITVTRGTIEHFARQAPADLACRLAFIDGDHGYPALVRDVEHVERWLSPGGWICFDDAFTGYEAVDRVINERILGSGRYDCAYRITRKCFVARRVPAAL
ncbi:class I SAM-dependent methyltransferase [Azospirillum sp. YIM DDC1]|uniref:Class I SAM-dependent methyltransferase n=1 Tax=Azospirillum aestuarii TaxID=2802052 RepID=A0ABS1I739_9PROT|nr:class I SAM-dependent methyltransferase [Azospirillum aestuarii]MBK4722886.1 class I SAM-dependent methyltransferase [Azospirillum aestuarii]